MIDQEELIKKIKEIPENDKYVSCLFFIISFFGLYFSFLFDINNFNRFFFHQHFFNWPFPLFTCCNGLNVTTIMLWNDQKKSLSD